MPLSTTIALSLSLATCSARLHAPPPNERPIIGILTLPNSIPGFSSYESYFPASYAMWLASGGARVVPLPFTASSSSTLAMLKSLNGVLFTGGGASFTNADGSLTPFAQTAALIYNESVTSWARGEPFPLWGTCQGHELIAFLASGANASILASGFDSENLTLPLDFAPAAATSRMYGALPADIVSIFASEPVTMNNHMLGVDPATFAASSLAQLFSLLSTNEDRAGRPFVSSLEGQAGLPIFTTQYHPEKVQFEWRPDEVINHSADSVLANSALARFFVNQTRANGAGMGGGARSA